MALEIAARRGARSRSAAIVLRRIVESFAIASARSSTRGTGDLYMGGGDPRRQQVHDPRSATFTENEPLRCGQCGEVGDARRPARPRRPAQRAAPSCPRRSRRAGPRVAEDDRVLPAWLADPAAILGEPGEYLCFEDGDEIVVVPLTREWTRIGRGLAADVRFDDPTVSRRHALIVRNVDGVRVLDDRSLNGVFVNGAARRVEPARATATRSASAATGSTTRRSSRSPPRRPPGLGNPRRRPAEPRSTAALGAPRRGAVEPERGRQHPRPARDALRERRARPRRGGRARPTRARSARRPRSSRRARRATARPPTSSAERG